MNLAELVCKWTTEPIPDCTISGLHNDSRKIKPGYLFIAYPGLLADGRMFIDQAVKAGAVAVVYEPSNLPASWSSSFSIPCIAIPDLNEKLGAIANQFYGYPSKNMSVIGVTGTNGKTTIAYQLAQAYELLGNQAAYIGTIGQGHVNALKPVANTTPDALCLQQLLADYHQQTINHVCMEVSSHALSQKRVDGIEFKQAIYTNLSHEHLDYHHTMAEYASAKAKLFATPGLQSVIINNDDAYAHVMKKNIPLNCKTLTYGLDKGADVYAYNCKISMQGSSFDVQSPWGKHSITINTLGDFNVYNSLAVFACLLADGYAPANLLPVMSKLHASPGRMEVVSQAPYILVDYAHTPDALENVLLTLNKLKQARLIVVFGCGGDRDKAKRPMMGKIASEHADIIIITSDNPRKEDPAQIIQEISNGLINSNQAIVMVERELAIQKAIDLAEKDDIILIAGKGHETYQEIGKERFVFSDKEMALKYIKA